MRIRSQSIRSKIIALLLPPLVSLVALWIFAVSLTVGSASNILATQTNFDKAGKPAEVMTTELQRERKASLAFLGAGRSDPDSLDEQIAATDKAVDTYRRLSSSDEMHDAATAEGRRRLDEIARALDGLADLRDGVRAGQLNRAGAMREYSSIVDAIFRLYPALRGIEEGSVGKDSRSVVALARAREVLAQEDALLGGVAAARRFAAGEPTQLVALIGAQRFQFAEAAPQLADKAGAAYERVAAGQPATRLRALEDKLAADARVGSAVPIDMNAWRTAYDGLVEQLRTVELDAGEDLIARGKPIGIAVFVRLGVAALVGLVAVLVSVLLSVRIARSLIRRLTGLRESAQRLADERLPAVVRRLRRGEQVDIATEAPPLNFGRDEIGDVGRAFGAAQRTAIEAAVQESRLRQGLNDVFLNISRRSQALLHRQLDLLDKMERRTTVPEELEDLFRVDHLATRMRRHAEDLVILAGAAPGRGWTQPIAMIDVIRGAVSEVADYTRVDVIRIPDVSLAGPAVGDMIHMLAELIENATEYSPPHTAVTVTGQMVPNGFAVEIEDRGLGMPQHEIDAANVRLANPPEFDPAHSARLGLFVVSLLAARHDVRVMLRRSPYGGVTTVALIPPELIVTAQALEAAPEGAPEDQPGAGGAPGAQVGDATTENERIAPVLALTPALGAVGGDERRPRAGRLAALERGATGRSGTGAPVGHPDRANGGPTVPVGTSSGALFPVDRDPASQGGSGGGFPEDEEYVGELTEDGLPLRRRQASLAPQLRVAPPPDETDPEPASTRTPEEIRAMMASYQSGTRRGRQDAANLPDEPPDVWFARRDGAGDPSPRPHDSADSERDR